MITPLWIRKTLQLQHVSYEELYHPEANTAQELAHREHVSGHRVAKVVVVRADDRFLELVVPASRRVLLDRVRQMLGARDLRLATEEELENTFTGCEPGAIPALRHWPGIDVLMDAALDIDGDIVFQAGTHCNAIRLNFEDWYRAVRPQIGIFSEPTNPQTSRSSSELCAAAL